MDFFTQLFQKPSIFDDSVSYEAEVYVAGAIGVGITVILCIVGLVWLWLKIDEKLFDDVWIRIWKVVSCVIVVYIGYKFSWNALDRAPNVIETIDNLKEIGQTVALLGLFGIGGLICWFSDL